MTRNAVPEDQPLPDHLSLLVPAQRAEVAARRAAAPSNAFEAILAATVPAEGDPRVPLVDDTPAYGMPLTQGETPEALPDGLSLLTPAQRAALRARRGA